MTTTLTAEECTAAAQQWEAGAEADESMAAREREIGLDLSRPGASPGDARAEIARRCARVLRAEAATGQAHCMCHEQPEVECPWAGQGMRL